MTRPFGVERTGFRALFVVDGRADEERRGTAPCRYGWPDVGLEKVIPPPPAGAAEALPAVAMVKTPATRAVVPYPRRKGTRRDRGAPTGIDSADSRAAFRVNGVPRQLRTIVSGVSPPLRRHVARRAAGSPRDITPRCSGLVG